MIYIAYLIGGKFSKEAGYIAALFFALDPSLVNNSHFVTSDISITLNMCLCILFALKYEEKQSYWRLIPMTLFAALGMLDKYPGILTCGMIGLMIMVCHRKNIKTLIKHAFVTLGLYVAFILVIFPNLLWDYHAILERIQIENRPIHMGSDGLGFIGNILFYVQRFFYSWQGGDVVLVAFLVSGMVYLGLVRERRNIVFSVLPIWWILLSTRALHWDRWGVPMYAGALLICAVGLGHWVAMVGRKKFIKISLLSVIVGVYLYFPLARTLEMDASLCAVDTREIAYEKANELGITAQNSIFDDSTPFYPRGNNGVSWTNKTSLVDGQLVVNEVGKRFIIQSSRQLKLLKKEPERYPEKLAKYVWLENNRKPIEIIRSKVTIKGNTNIPLVKAFRELMTAILNGEEGYITGYEQRIYDISDIPTQSDVK